MFHCNLWLIANAVFRKSTKNMFIPVNWVYRIKESKEGPTGSLGDGLLREGCCGSCSSSPTVSLLQKSHLHGGSSAIRARSSCSAEQALFAAQRAGRWLKAVRWCRAAASRRGCPFLPAAEAPSHMLIWLLILPNAKPIQLTELAENKYRNRWIFKKLISAGILSWILASEREQNCTLGWGDMRHSRTPSCASRGRRSLWSSPRAPTADFNSKQFS